ncbi:polyketide synthase module and related protein [Candidatus Scalindua japonica]|uniref:Polyketide synthase module and related protein n=2 Tax=Candidatus Scalindua japonica TaxID=1284222 RepID=A0A286TWH6_9BACT|nr:SDR family NAD(P)-dependent oxidoreductase [Candidatus Scalindua japonica]GAX60238.1 polyketide synthase module and related protein [Candidatus Scalindua japonica]
MELTAGKEGDAFIKSLIQNNKTGKLARLWVSGFHFDWKTLYHKNSCQRIPLPTYPFARERCWMPEVGADEVNIAGGVMRLHPLLERNTSDLTEQRFTTVLTGGEFYLNDYRVQGEKMLPGVAYIEMARAAGSVASKGDITRIRNIAWAGPVRVNSAAQELSISLYPENSNISFEVSTHTEGDERVVHSQGILETGDYGKMTGKTLDLNALRSRCDGEIDGPGCYKAFSSRGLGYGPSFRGIESLRYNEREVMARLIMPESVRDVSGQYMLHPSLMDSALQATLELAVSSTGVGGAGDGVSLPFALKDVFIYGSIPETAYAYVRFSEGADIEGRVLKYDIDITDEEGRIVVEMKEFMVMALQGGEGALKPQSDCDVLYATTRWEDHALQGVEAKSDVDYLIVIADSGEGLSELLSAECPDAEIVALSTSAKDVGRDVEGMFIEVFEKIRGRLENKPKRVQRILVLVPDGDAGYCYAPLAGLLKTAHIEGPRIEGRMIYCPLFTEESRAQFVAMVKQESASEVGGDIEVRYSDGVKERQVKRLVEVKEVTQGAEAVRLIKPGGVYWITGGFGGLGRIFAEHFGQTEGVKLVLSGRSVLNEEKQQELDTLRQDGLDVSYIQSDISKLDDVAKAFKAIKEKHGKLDGVIHSAGVIRDAFIQKKTDDQIREVFSSKVNGAVNLDAATKDEELDFMVFFSSVAGVLGNVGQSDYAGANAFLDAFAVYRQEQVNAGKCSGKTVSIGWPLWREGGMKVDDQVEHMMKDVSGMSLLETSVGVDVFERLLMTEYSHVIVAEGDVVKMREKLLLQKPAQPVKAQKALRTTPQVDMDELIENVKEDLVRDVSDMLKVKKEDIDFESDISDYGFDSVTLTEFANKINQEYSVELNPAVFFEHSTLGSFADYLVLQNREQLVLKYLSGGREITKEALMVDAQEDEVGLKPIRSRFMAQSDKPANTSYVGPCPVAVIGMSGRMPGSSNLEEFWKNLEGGKDLISEIPADRWDWRAYYGDPQKEVNKTNIKWGGFIDDVDKFDPMFFGISPKEAELMDPQQRLFMECVWETIENAGYKASDLSGTKTGLFVGVSNNDYHELLAQGNVGIEAHTPLGLSHSVLANRISYILDLRGPSEPIDTACSSSLVSIHRAIMSIESENCELAIAGGVCTLLSPAAFIAFSKAGMLCEDGRCKSFSDKANGYVRGEGVGAVFLKPLSKAIADGDHIYGVIRGTSENHGGRANSLTAPNPNAQSDLLITAYEKAGISPDTVSYMEMHGTGTGLGDPVEVNGLKNAFSELYRRTHKEQKESNYCGIGSVKTNIGHLESAAGIAGVLKVLLALQHKTLPASLHCENVNPYIDLKGSPFYIVKETQEWKEMVDERKHHLPRRAGVSSFGFGGANAHIILEEYIPGRTRNTPVIEVNASHPAIVVLSARNSACLKASAERLLGFISGKVHNRNKEHHLSDIAYTLQVGREAMESRVAFLVKNEKGLIDKLDAFSAGRQDIDDCFIGEVKQNKDTLRPFTADDLKETIDKWIARGNLGKLAALWAKGFDLDWSLLYGEQKPKRISLPTYPFARERYWVPETDEHGIVNRHGDGLGGVSVLHPLLDRVDLASSLAVNRGFVFGKVLKPTDTILDHHQVRLQPVFPGVGYLEMITAAVKQIQPEKRFVLKQVVWVQPIIVTEEQYIQLILKARDTGSGFYYEIISNQNAEPVIHSRGYIEEVSGPKEDENVDIEQLKQKLSSRWQDQQGKTRFYEAISQAGIQYGEYFQGVEAIWGGDQEALGLIQIPEFYKKELKDYYLHPALMDAALQCCAGIVNPNPSSQIQLPFSMGEVECYHRLTSKMYAYVKKESEQRYHLALVNEEGQVCVKCHDFEFRPMRDPLEKLMFVPRWVREPLKIVETKSQLSSTSRVLIIYHAHSFGLEQSLIESEGVEECIQLCLGAETEKKTDSCWSVDLKDPDGIISCLRQLPEFRKIYFLGGLHTNADYSLELPFLEERQEYGVLSWFRTIKAMVEVGVCSEGSGADSSLLRNCHYLNSSSQVDPGGASLLGLTQSLEKEYPVWRIKNIDFSQQLLCKRQAHKTLVHQIQSEPVNVSGNSVVYRDGQRYVERLTRLSLPASQSIGFRECGVYVVLGGAGGIGYELTRYLIKHYQDQVFWLGRRELNDDIQGKIEAIGAEGVLPVYIQADATDLDSMKQAVRQVKEQADQIHGVIHSAIVLRDKALERMDEETFCTVLAPKTMGSVILHQVLEAEPLDFMMFFSSAQSFAGAPGQSNYAAGCTFKDAYAHALRSRLSCSVHIINWGYWGSVGVVAKDEYQRRMAKQGINSIEPAEGMEVLERVISQGVNQIVPMKIAESVVSEMGIEPDHKIRIYNETQPSYLESISRQLPDRSGTLKEISTQGSAYKALDHFAINGLIAAVSRLGLFDDLSIPLEIEALRRGLGIVVKYERLFQELVDMLCQVDCLDEKEGLIILKQDIQSIQKQVKQFDLEVHSKELVQRHPYLNSPVQLLKPCLEALPDILTGKVPSTDIIFPNSSMDLVEGVYKGNPSADYFNECVADVVEVYVQERVKDLKDSEKICILEVGAGTGGTSASVFKRLKEYAEHLDYVYTDVSKSFLMYAEEHYCRGNPYVSVKMFDVEKPLAEQGIQEDYFDIVIGANVLHATQEMANTLDQVKGALKARGLLLLNEMGVKRDFITLTFGLLDGWWLYRDEEVRLKGSPGLSPESWERVLHHQGFDDVAFITKEAHHLGQQVIVAESNGLVCQKEVIALASRATGIVGETVSVSASDKQTVSSEVNRDTNMDLSTHQIAGFYDTTPQILKEKASVYIKRLLASTLKMPSDKIDTQVPFEKYGIDSILVVQLTDQLEKVFGNLPRTLFFEYQTMEQLTDYFIEQHRDKLTKLLGLEVSISAKKGLKVTQKGIFKERKSDLICTSEEGKETGLSEISYVDPSEQKISQQQFSDDIAVIGISGRYPQARGVKELWDNLKSGKDCITEIPKERWEHSKYFKHDKSGVDLTCGMYGGFIDDVDRFDPLFFNISPREAEIIDPQERLFLETAWETLEDAGYTRECLQNQKGNVGVYVGVMYEEYQFYGIEESLKGKLMAFSSSPSSIANRVSYFCNFHGPSIAVDTMCSSSLTAIHLACQSLKRGDSKLALAGGVNVSVHPNKFIMLKQGKFLSNKGRCQSFGVGGDGFIPGEGVGCVLLKPLQKAINDGDHIYAVIKGAAVNHGGKTNGYTVPNPNAQRDVIGEAIKEARVDPRYISYIEAHGTGTSLGDPIEIAGLSKMYQTFTNDRQFCAIGSVKSNIGHCESAAGIAGLTKVLLQLKYRKLVPSLHSETLNPNIDFSQTPFVVQQDFSAWERPVIKDNGHEKECPRIAGISSFGAGGSNAHVIIEEYIPAQVQSRPLIKINASRQALVVLSARNQERLKGYAERLLSFVKEQEKDESYECHLADIAYTLQVGREAMDSRAAFLVKDNKDLINQLEAFAAGKEGIEDCYTGEVKRNKDVLSVFAVDDDLQEAIDKWIAKGKLSKLAELWVKGLVLDWDLLYGEHKPCRISLPTYPFARERCWVPDGGNQRSVINNQISEVIHPLLHRNTSDLTEQQFTTRLTGKEFFLSDHRINDEKVLPGVVYVEMARAAGSAASKGDITGIRNIVWARPVRVDSAAQELSISLYPENSNISFEVSTHTEGDERVVHSQGILETGDYGDMRGKTLDLGAIRSRCDGEIDGPGCYKAFSSRGLSYGPSFHGIEALRYNEREVLARLIMPESVRDVSGQYVLHPSLMDSALQATLGLAVSSTGVDGTGDGVYLPFALNEVFIYGSIPETAYAYVRV